VAYPALLEPSLTLGRQSLAWALGFVILVLLIAACARIIFLRFQAQGADHRAAAENGLSDQVDWPLRLRCWPSYHHRCCWASPSISRPTWPRCPCSGWCP
jgi:hypothetical protein